MSDEHIRHSAASGTVTGEHTDTSLPSASQGRQQPSSTAAPLPSDVEEVEAASSSRPILKLHTDVPKDDHSDTDSALGSDRSDTTSITSSIYAGHIENGRRYQITREGEYWGPSDKTQFEAMQGVHLTHLVLDSQAANPLFRAPIPITIQNILDIGTGNGAWAQDVADRYPGAVVQGVDLYRPPDTWVPPNCIFAVDDVLKPWMFKNSKFDFIHMRWMFGAFTPRQWDNLYDQVYKNLVPSGWIEQVEPSICFQSDDGTLLPDSLLVGWGPKSIKCAAVAGKPLNTVDTFKAKIEEHGFTNLNEKVYKCPSGDWAKHPVLKEAGRLNKLQLMQGMEGYAMFLWTRFGLPQPWSPEEVQVYLAKIRKEMNDPKLHSYLIVRRVWAQKPFDTAPRAESKTEVSETF